jgi:NADH dehydrogenase
MSGGPRILGASADGRTPAVAGRLPPVLLLTGATGTIGLPLLRRLTAAGAPVRCLVRDPRRLGAERVRVQIALGELADPHSFRHALRGVETVVHLASPIRDQPGGSIEELAGIATWRLVQAAQRAGVRRFVFFSALGASTRSSARLMRAKAIAERAVIESSLEHTIFAPGWVYDHGDPFLRLLDHLSVLPVMPISGSGRARFQPIWAEDVAACVLAALPGASHSELAANARFELAGPETLSYEEIVRHALAAAHRRRRIVGVPTRLLRRGLRATELLMGPAAPATWDEAALLELTLLAARGIADVEQLGVAPRAIADVLGA